MSTAQRAQGQAKKRVLLHLCVSVLWFLVFVWPIAKAFNRVEPYVLGLPLYVFMEWVLGPLLVFLNILAYVLWFTKADEAKAADRGKGA